MGQPALVGFDARKRGTGTLTAVVSRGRGSDTAAVTERALRQLLPSMQGYQARYCTGSPNAVHIGQVGQVGARLCRRSRPRPLPSAREASGNASNQAAPSVSSSASSVPGCLAPRAVSIACLRQMKGCGSALRQKVGYVERGRTRARYAMFAAGVRRVNSSQADRKLAANCNKRRRSRRWSVQIALLDSPISTVGRLLQSNGRMVAVPSWQRYTSTTV